MATILCIETATTNCSVALSVNGSVIGLLEDNNNQYSHAEKLHVFVAKVLEQANITKNDLDAIAVSKGPGSYTGLRIGVSTAKGLCYALDIQLIATTTLKTLAAQITDSSIDFIVPMLDARRMEVYSAVYNNGYQEVRETRAEVLSENSFSEYLSKGKVVFMGNGAEKFKAICKHKNALFIDEKSPSAREMAVYAEEQYKKSDIEDVAYFEPYYLKDFMKS